MLVKEIRKLFLFNYICGFVIDVVVLFSSNDVTSGSHNKTKRDSLIYQIYFWSRTLHVLGRFTVHHRESSTVYTATGICHTGFADDLLAESCSRYQAVIIVRSYKTY